MLDNPAQDSDLLLQVASQARALAKNTDDPYYLDLCAQAYGRAGNVKMAADLERKAVDAAQAGGSLPATWLEKARTRLKSYQM